MFKVYGTTTCGFCKRATALLQERGHNYSYWSLDDEPELMRALKKEYGWRTVPLIIFVDALNDNEITFIGGYTDLVECLNDEEPSV